MTLNKDIKEIIKRVATDYSHEEEYDGRMENWCYYCGKYQGKEESHEKGCLVLKARKIKILND